MFDFYLDCTFQSQSSIPWVAIISAIIALFALIIGFKNFASTRRAQNIQAHINLINLETDLRKYKISFNASVENYITKTIKQPIDNDEIKKLINEKNNCFELYISCADKMASLIASEYLRKQFKNKRDFKKEYCEIFKEVKICHADYGDMIIGKDGMIRSVDMLIKEWYPEKNLY